MRDTLPVASTGLSATANNYYKGTKFPIAAAIKDEVPTCMRKGLYAANLGRTHGRVFYLYKKSI